MAGIKTKKTFGGANVDHVSPQPGDEWPKVINTVLTFEEALKLHLGLGQALAKLNSYNRSTKAGRAAAVNLSIRPAAKRITVIEART